MPKFREDIVMCEHNVEFWSHLELILVDRHVYWITRQKPLIALILVLICTIVKTNSVPNQEGQQSWRREDILEME